MQLVADECFRRAADIWKTYHSFLHLAPSHAPVWTRICWTEGRVTSRVLQKDLEDLAICLYGRFEHGPRPTWKHACKLRWAKIHCSGSLCWYNAWGWHGRRHLLDGKNSVLLPQDEQRREHWTKDLKDCLQAFLELELALNPRPCSTKQ